MKRYSCVLTEQEPSQNQAHRKINIIGLLSGEVVVS